MKRLFEFLANNAVSLTLLITAAVALSGGVGFIWQRVSPVSVVSNVAPAPSSQQITNVIETLPDSLVRLIVETRTAENSVRAQAAELAEKLSVTSAAVQTFFEIIGQNHVPEGEIRARLVEVAIGYISMRDSIAHLRGLSEEMVRLFSGSVASVAAGNLREADALLARAEYAAFGAVQSFNKNSGDDYRIAAIALAEIRAARGDLALTKLDYEVAISRYSSAVEAVTGETVIKGRIQLKIGDAYFKVWSVTNDTDALQQSAQIYTAAFSLLNACLCDVRNFAHHSFQFGTALLKLAARPDEQNRLVEAAGLFKSALDQREVRLPATDIVRARTSMAEAYALDSESDEDPSFTIEHFNRAAEAVQAAGDANMASDLVPAEEAYKAKLMLARTFAQLAKQASLGLEPDYVRELLSLTDKAIADASQLQHLTADENARLELARSEIAVTKATMDRDPGELEKARLGFVMIEGLAVEAEDHALEALALDKERRLRGRVFDLSKSLTK